MHKFVFYSKSSFGGSEFSVHCATYSGVYSLFFSITKEYVECEDRLVRSACGSELADFTLALSLHQKFSLLKLRMRDCEYIPSSAYKGMSFSPLISAPKKGFHMTAC